jgi:SAM-dependent methyltransferase
MIGTIGTLLTAAFCGSLFLPILAVFAAMRSRGADLSAKASFGISVYAVVAVLMSIGFARLVGRLKSHLSTDALAQAAFVERIPSSYVSGAILSAAGLSLFLELSIIRWQGTVLEFFAFYKNYGLLSCFAGLGLGYALSRSNKGIPLNLTLPLLAWQFALLTLIRYGLETRNLRMIPFREQLTMGVSPAKPFQLVGVYLLLAIVFLLTSLAALPVGQLCGRLMERKPQLSAYGLNLLGSLGGVVLMFLVSMLWTPPVIWFALCALVILFFVVRSARSVSVAAASTALVVTILSWPVNPYWNRIYSPYQLLEIGNSETGLMSILAAGTYYQRVYNLSSKAIETSGDPNLLRTKEYYELPYRIITAPREVAIVGAGTGNDVAAALRAGAARVDAIEIDPAILRAGRMNHPERPYDDSRVNAIVNDARSFFRNTTSKYDVIAYGLLDSHTLLSQASSVRLDSFVYTIEGLREARSRLKSHGILSLSFAVLSDALGAKIYRMMTEAFDGKEPICVFADGNTMFLQSRDGKLLVPSSLIAEAGFAERSGLYKNLSVKVDVSTDDWPFLYMPRRVYPVSYLVMICLIVVLSLILFTSFLGGRLQLSEAPFFFLGAGFMLVETKAITEMGLTFGNTWEVIAFGIASVLVMAFLANTVVAWLQLRSTYAAYFLLILSLFAGWWIAGLGGLPSTTLGRVGTALLLSCPLFFSGIVFSILLANGFQVSGALSMNLLGAMCGGILEYNSMYFGFRFLYLLATTLYVLALLSSISIKSSSVAPAG